MVLDVLMPFKRSYDTMSSLFGGKYSTAKRRKTAKRSGYSLTATRKRKPSNARRMLSTVRSRNLFRRTARSEIKYRDTTQLGPAAIPNESLAGSFGYHLTIGIDQGSGQHQRIGAVITLKNLNLRFKLRRRVVSGVAYNDSVRLILLRFINSGRDLNSAGSLAYVLGQTSPATSDANVLSPYNTVNTQNFQILMDRVIEVDGGHGEEYFEAKNIPMNLPVKYLDGSTGGGHTDMKAGAIWLVVASTNLDNFSALFSMYSRVKYTDS